MNASQLDLVTLLKTLAGVYSCRLDVVMSTATATFTHEKRSRVAAKALAYVELTKPRIALMLVLTSAAGFYLASAATVDLVVFANAMAAITILAFGVATLNQYLERSIDGLMERTATRPLPTSRISAREALIFGSVQCFLAEVYLLLAVNALTAALGLVVIVGYVFVYTPLKTRTTVSTALGAIPGALPPLMGWTAAANDVTIGGWALFATQFLWQFPHFFAIAWLYRDEYAKAGVKMLPVVDKTGRLTARQIVLFSLMLFPVSLAPFFFSMSGFIFLIGAIVLGSWFLWVSVTAAVSRSHEQSRRLLYGSIIYLPVLFLLMVMDKF
jgi:heme o synthase